MIFLLHFYSLFEVTQAQTCKLINKEINLLNIAEGETYTLNLTNYFIGDALMYSLDERFGYFQSNTQYFIKEQRVFRSMTQFNLNQIPKNSIFAHFALVEQYDDHIMQVDIFKSHLDSTNRFIFLQEFQNDIFFNCYDITQFQNYLLLTCIDIDKQEIFFYFVDPLKYQSRFLKYRFKIWKVKQNQFKVKSFGYFVALHIVNQLNEEEEEIEQFDLNFKLYIFQVNTVYQNQQLKIKGMEQFIILENVMDFVISDSLLMWIKHNEAGIYFLNMISENLEQTQILEDIFHEIYLGISWSNQQILNQQQTIAIWEEKYIYTFIWNFEEPQKCLQKIQQLQNGQITIDNTFETQVYISYEYLVITNINGISIFPTFGNWINDGFQLYYYPAQSLLSSFDYLIQILLVLSSSGINTYYITNPQFKVDNFKQRDEFIEIYARTNQYKKQSKYCSKLKLFLKQVENPINTKNLIQKESFITASNTLYVKIEKKKKQSTYFFEFHKYFLGPILNFKIIEKCNSQQLDETIQVTQDSLLSEVVNNWIQLSKNQKRCQKPQDRQSIESYLSFIRYEAFDDYIQLDECWAKQLELPFYCKALSKVILKLPTIDTTCIQYGNTIYFISIQVNRDRFYMTIFKIKDFVSLTVKVKQFVNYPFFQLVDLSKGNNLLYLCFRYGSDSNSQVNSKFYIIDIQKMFSNDDSNHELSVEFNNTYINSFGQKFFDFRHYIFLYSFLDYNQLRPLEIVTVITHNERQIFIIGTIKQKSFQEKQLKNQFFVSAQGILRRVFSNLLQKQIFLFIANIDIQLAILRLSQNFEVFFDDIPAQQIIFTNQAFEPVNVQLTDNFIYFFTRNFYRPIKDKLQLIYVYKYSNTILNWAYYIIENEYDDEQYFVHESLIDFDIVQINNKLIILQNEPRIQVDFHQSDSQTCQRIKFNFEVQQSLQNINLLPNKVFKQVVLQFIDQEEHANVENEQDLIH